jgi:signal transduction histidine kinase
MDTNPAKGETTPDASAGPAEIQADRVREETEFEFSPACLLVTDGQGLIQRANHAAAALLRCPKEFLFGKPLGLFVSQGQRPRFYESLSRLWQGVTSDTFETRVARRGEGPRDVILMASVEADRETFRWLLRDVTTLKRAEDDRAELLKRLVSAQEDERQRIARDLHDNVSQLLTALTLGLQTIALAGPLPEGARKSLDLVQRVAKDLGRAVHDLAHNLRPIALDAVGLHAALGQLLSDWATQQPGCTIDYRADAVAAVRLPPEIETTIYRVIQESLTNVFRHARANNVRVTVERNEGLVTVTVWDDGVGFDSEVARDPAGGKRFGLIGMRERAALVGGSLEIQSRPGGGTTVTARFPVPRVRTNTL